MGRGLDGGIAAHGDHGAALGRAGFAGVELAQTVPAADVGDFVGQDPS